MLLSHIRFLIKAGTNREKIVFIVSRAYALIHKHVKRRQREQIPLQLSGRSVFVIKRMWLNCVLRDAQVVISLSVKTVLEFCTVHAINLESRTFVIL